MTVQIPLSKKGSKHRGRFVATVDDEDFERVDALGDWSVIILEHLT